MSDEVPRVGWRVRGALAIVAGSTAAMGLYAIVRVAQALIFTEPDPALVIWSEHAGFFWRTWTVGYVGGMAAIVTWMLAARDAPRVAAFLVRALPIATAVLAAQAVLIP
ncbi:MAG: hypothetical protein JWO86_2917 [Myxococcaceae bacterium]|nr:hypothetical protein [Myxococcaceae bacterium]